jgi:hypothetical protein
MAVCDEFGEIPREEVKEAMKRLKMPIEAIVGGNIVADCDTGAPFPAKTENGGTESEEVYQRLLMLKTEIEVKWFELGKVLQVMFEKRYYLDYAPNWKEFCLQCLDLKWRAADYLRITRMKCDEVGIKQDVAAQIGWAKLKEVVPVITKANKEHWVKESRKEGTTTASLNTKVRLAMGKITREEAEKVPSKLFFSVYEDQLENIERALELARRLTVSDSRGYCLEMICADFRGTYESEDGDFSKVKIISGLLSRIEAVMKVKFKVEAVDVETGEIIFEIP